MGSSLSMQAVWGRYQELGGKMDYEQFRTTLCQRGKGLLPNTRQMMAAAGQGMVAGAGTFDPLTDGTFTVDLRQIDPRSLSERIYEWVYFDVVRVPRG